MASTAAVLFGNNPNQKSPETSTALVPAKSEGDWSLYGTDDTTIASSISDYVRKYGPKAARVVGEALEVFGKNPKTRVVGWLVDLVGSQLDKPAQEKMAKAADDKEAKAVFPVDSNGRAVLLVEDMSKAQAEYIKTNIPELGPDALRQAVSQARLAQAMTGAAILRLFQNIPAIDPVSGSFVAHRRTLEEALLLIRTVRAVMSDQGMAAVLAAFEADTVHHAIH